MPDKITSGGSPLTRKKFKAECVRQVAAGARQTDVARAQGLFHEGSKGGKSHPKFPAFVGVFFVLCSAGYFLNSLLQ